MVVDITRLLDNPLPQRLKRELGEKSKIQKLKVSREELKLKNVRQDLPNLTLAFLQTMFDLIDGWQSKYSKTKVETN